ncbi:hypothetical protein DFH06DRAFT_1234787, partial [Mycena polygramma]
MSAGTCGSRTRWVCCAPEGVGCIREPDGAPIGMLPAALAFVATGPVLFINSPSHPKRSTTSTSTPKLPTPMRTSKPARARRTAASQLVRMPPSPRAQTRGSTCICIRIFVNCLCDPTAVRKIPGCTITEARPSVAQVLDRVDPVAATGADCCGPLAPIRRFPLGREDRGPERASGLSSASANTDDLEKGAVGGGSMSRRSGVTVFAAGPRSLIREAGNAFALANLGKGRAARSRF